MNFLLKVAFAFNNFNPKRFLGADETPTTETPAEKEGLEKITSEVTTTVTNVLKIILPFIFTVITLVGVVYCIILGVNYAKAEKTEDREEAKKRLVGAIVGFGIAIVASAIMWLLAGLNVFDGLFS